MENTRDRSGRLHHSSPTLAISSSPEIRRRRNAEKTSQEKGNDALSFIVSAFYAKVLVILGIALPITDAIVIHDYDSYDAFYIYLYVGSIIFLLYMYAIKIKDKAVNGIPRLADDHLLYPGDPNYYWKCNNGRVRYGSFYFRMGVTGFGVGSVIYTGLQFGQYFELSSNDDCNNILKAAKPLARIFFGLLQMLFIFSYSDFQNVQRCRIIARFGLMHMIATNLCEWLFIIIEDTQRDIYKSAKKHHGHLLVDNTSLLYQIDSQFFSSYAYHVTKHIYEHRSKCLSGKIMERILTNSQQYLAPCIVDYSLLCAVILSLIWKNSSSDSRDNFNETVKRESNERQNGYSVVHSKRQDQFSVDCAQAHKGLFAGILALALTIMSLIMFFELLQYEEYRDIAVFQVNIWEAVLFWAGTAAAVYCILALRDVGYRKMETGLELEHLLLFVTQSGVFMYFLFQIIGAFLMGWSKGTGGIMRIITPLSALIQSSWQTVLIMNAWKKRCTTLDQIYRKPGRQLITFLLVANISLCVVNRLKNTHAASHPNQMDLYGILAWNIITHVSMPFVVSYRFQSTVCFYEIWKHVYKIKPLSKSCDNIL